MHQFYPVRYTGDIFDFRPCERPSTYVIFVHPVYVHVHDVTLPYGKVLRLTLTPSGNVKPYEKLCVGKVIHRQRLHCYETSFKGYALIIVLFCYRLSQPTAVSAYIYILLIVSITFFFTMHTASRPCNVGCIVSHAATPVFIFYIYPD